MFKFIGKALAGVLLTGDARKAVSGGAKASSKPKKAAASASSGMPQVQQSEAITKMQAQVKGLITEDRAELIRQAMRVRAAKQTILADLSDDDRARLVATAMKALLREGREKKE
jgi:hypothetical protein